MADDTSHDEERKPLTAQAWGDSSNTSTHTTPATRISSSIFTTNSSPRKAYTRIALDDLSASPVQSPSRGNHDESKAVPPEPAESARRGLGISSLPSTEAPSPIKRVPVGSKFSPQSPSAGDPLLSPALSMNQSDIRRHHHSHGRSTDKRSNPQLSPPLFPTGDPLVNLRRLKSRSIDDSESWKTATCRSKRNIYQGRSHWLAVAVVVLSLYSTVLSGLWLFVAIKMPRYGKHIHLNGSLAPSTASLLTALFAKTIELSFVTVFISFLGQVLSRRAIAKRSRGVTVADMSMRSWIMQPGTLITHWETVRYAGVTVLGGVCLSAAFIALLYTTASDALVAPKLKWGDWQDKVLYGKVATSYANPQYVAAKCRSPVTLAEDDQAGTTCLQLQHAGQSFHNYLKYLETWTDYRDNGNVSDALEDLRARPSGFGLMFDNTTVRGSWIEVLNMTKSSQDHGDRIVNNVTMAFPHAGVFAAARDPRNDIMQPEDLDGLGDYAMIASVPSPAVNIICANMTKAELAPIIYDEWPGAKGTLNTSNSNPTPLIPLVTEIPWLNATKVDDLFGWGEKYQRRPPVFARYPEAYNTIIHVLNSTGYGDSLYMLAKSGADEPTFMLCSMRSFLSPNCSTRYNASLTGGSLESVCEDKHDKLAYARSEPNAPIGENSADWTNIASEWASAIQLNNGITDGNASNARLLTELIPISDTLNLARPSLAEALAVLSGSTLIMSSRDSPFIHYWNYTGIHILENPQYQGFNGSVMTREYASGGTQRWQGVFYIVLALVFVANVCCLIYWIPNGGLVTDFTEPQNLFALAINSPPSKKLAGSCGGGPEKEQFCGSWYVNLDGEHVFIENGEESAGAAVYSSGFAFRPEASPISSAYNRLSGTRRSLL